MKIYVAGKFQEYERVRSFMRRVRTKNHFISHDWTRTTEFDDNGHPKTEKETDLSLQDQIKFATDDFNGVKTAELFIQLGHPELNGAMVEFGIALQRGIPCWIVDPKKHTIFYNLPGVTIYESEAAALADL